MRTALHPDILPPLPFQQGDERAGPEIKWPWSRRKSVDFRRLRAKRDWKGGYGVRAVRKAWMVAVGVTLFGATFAAAATIKDRVAIGGSVGLFLPQDAKGGGFRFAATGVGGEREVSLDSNVRWTFHLQYGLLERLSLEFESSRYEGRIGAETAFWDPDASTATRYPVYSNGRISFVEPFANGDEEAFPLTVGRMTMSPISLNALWHWGTERKTSAFAGGGPSYVFIKYETGSDYRDFVSYSDGSVENSLGLNLKGGVEVELAKKWFFDFYADYLFVDKQFEWKGVRNTFGTMELDLNQDGIADLFGFPADYRLVDPGSIRLDGLTVAAGIRFAFPIGKEKAEKAEPKPKKEKAKAEKPKGKKEGKEEEKEKEEKDKESEAGEQEAK